MVQDLPQWLFPQLRQCLVSAEPPPPETLWEAWNVRPSALMSLPILEVSDDTMTLWVHAYELAWNLRVRGGKAAKPQTAEESVYWPYIQACAHLLLGKTSRATVPIVKVDGNQQGRVQFLHLDKCEGAAALHQHPQFAWGRRFDRAFLDGLAAAWEQANGHDVQPCQIFWHITEANGSPVKSTEQTGSSASAAALRAFWHLRRDHLLDEDVFVLASCDSGEGSIQDVGDLDPKISAILQHHNSLEQERRATIVIATTTTIRTPQDETAIARAAKLAKVKTVATTADLNAVRSCTPPAQLVGSHSVLFRLPIWASCLILYVVTMGIVYLLRDIFEGLGYQVAYSAQFGGALLVGAVFFAARILQRGEALSWWLISLHFHAFAAVISVIFGVTCWSLVRPTHWGDIYYQLFIAPLLLYLALTLLPVIAINGKTVERVCVVCFALVQIALVAYDFKDGRFTQLPWIEKHGFPLKH